MKLKKQILDVIDEEIKWCRDNKFKAEEMAIWSAKDEQKFMDHANKILEEVYKLEKHTYEKNG